MSRATRSNRSGSTSSGFGHRARRTSKEGAVCFCGSEGSVDVQHCGSTVLVSASGDLDETAGEALQEALDGVTTHVRDVLVDLHGVAVMDADGLLHLLEVHRRAECLGLRALVTGWQPQRQQCMAEIAGIRGPGSATGERFAMAGFRRLVEERARRARDSADFAAGWLPRA